MILKLPAIGSLRSPFGKGGDRRQGGQERGRQARFHPHRAGPLSLRDLNS